MGAELRKETASSNVKAIVVVSSEKLGHFIKRRVEALTAEKRSIILPSKNTPFIHPTRNTLNNSKS
jgi:hypothetical protein